MTTSEQAAAGAPPPRAPSRVRPPAMTDVASLAGVSHQTVSRVLNGHPSVTPRTRTLVLAAVEELGYRPNTAARALATGRSRTLGVLARPGTLFGPTSLLYAVEEAAREAEYAVTVVSLESLEASSLASAMALLLRQGVDGVVAIAPLMGTDEAVARAARDVPFVAVEGAPDSGLAVVAVDQEQGARLATQHLLDLGHETVWHVSGPSGFLEAAGRLLGWRTTLEAAGASVPPALSGDWSPQSGFEAGQVLARIADATAVFAANDQMALGLLRALRENDRRVPQDVSVVGFDDVPEAGFFSPPLTTIRQDFTEVGRQSLAAIVAQMESGRASRDRVVIPAELVVRRSAAVRVSGPAGESTSSGR